MKTKYLFITIFSGIGLSLQAQSLQVAGLIGNENGTTEGRMVVAKADGEGREIQTVDLVSFSLRDGKSTVTENAIAMPDNYYLLPIPELNRNFEVPWSETTDRYAYRVRMTLTDGTRIISELIEDNGRERFRWIGADVKWTSFTQGDIGPKFDQSLGGPNPFSVGGISFYKSFSVHGKGSFTFDLPEDNPYSRLFTYYGIQDDRSAGDVRFSFWVDDNMVETHDLYAMTNPVKPADGIYLRKFETAISGKTKIVLDGDVIDDADYDHMNFPLGRLYLKPDTRKTQTADWPKTDELATDKPALLDIDARFSSGGTTYYEIISGSEYASIEGNKLNLRSIPEDKSTYIEVKAWQFGTDEYLPAAPSTCRFYIRNNKTVQKNEKLVLQNGDVIDRLVVYGDAESRGQVIVENGLAQVKELVLKYTFQPGTWNFVSFPSNINLDKASNLNYQGYHFNDSQKAYYIYEYSTQSRAEQPGKTAWKSLASPDVMRNKGYIMGISRSDDNPNETPVEVTFTLENTQLGLDNSGIGSLNVGLDLTQVTPDSEVTVYIEPTGVKGPPLKVTLQFKPEDLAALPMNHQRALDDARITFNPNRSGIRLTLPTSEKARVVFFDKKGKVIKAIKYESPQLIDVKDMPQGKYQLYIEYGNAYCIKELDLD